MSKNIFDLTAAFLKKTKKPLLAIIGPTASGKTAVSLEFARRFQGEIINADSRQVFQHLDIATAKITSAEMAGIPHHLFSFVQPDQVFTVAEWKEAAKACIKDILRRGKVPIICGGTGLYVNALTKGFTIPRVPPQPAFRAELERFSDEVLWERLRTVDSLSAASLHANNRKAVIRALEIAEFSKKTKSAPKKREKPAFEAMIIGVAVNRAVLYQKIDARVEKMLDSGLLTEVETLLKMGYKSGDPGMLAHGVPEALALLAGEITQAEFIAKMQKVTRNFAKRQLTWWRSDPRVVWFDPLSMELVAGAEV